MVIDCERINAAIESTKRLLDERLQRVAPGWNWLGADGHWLFLEMCTWSLTDGPPEMRLRGPGWMYDDDKASLVIEMALDGDEDADAALRHVAAGFVDGGGSMPPNLRTYFRPVAFGNGTRRSPPKVQSARAEDAHQFSPQLRHCSRCGGIGAAGVPYNP